MFSGVVTVEGAKGSTVNTQLQRASRLNSGTRLTKAKMRQAVDQMKLALAENGYHESTITYNQHERQTDQLVDIAFDVSCGRQARVGAVSVSVERGMRQEWLCSGDSSDVGTEVD